MKGASKFTHPEQQQHLKTREHDVMMLGVEDARVFMDALLTYEVPNEALRAAAKEYLIR